MGVQEYDFEVACDIDHSIISICDNYRTLSRIRSLINEFSSTKVINITSTINFTASRISKTYSLALALFREYKSEITTAYCACLPLPELLRFSSFEFRCRKCDQIRPSSRQLASGHRPFHAAPRRPLMLSAWPSIRIFKDPLRGYLPEHRISHNSR